MVIRCLSQFDRFLNNDATFCHFSTPASGNSASPYSATPQPVHERSSSWSDNNNDHDYQHARQRSWPTPADPLYDQHASSWSSPDQAHERQPSSWSPSYTNHNSSVAPPSSDSPAVVEPPPRFQMRPSSQAQSRSFKMLQSMVSDSEGITSLFQHFFPLR